MRKFLVWLMVISTALVGFSAVSAQDVEPSNLIATAWRLTAITTPEGETPAVTDSNVTLIFDTTGRIRGSAGCNNFSGDYTVEDDTLQLSSVTSPLIACLDEAVMQQESTYLAALDGDLRYEIDGDTLTIWYGDEGENTLVFEAAQNEFLLGTYWQLDSFVTFGTQEVVSPAFDDAEVTLEFMTGGEIAGFGGCNNYSAPYTFDDEGEISFGAVTSTRMACPASESHISHQERAFFDALESAESYGITADGQLTILYDNGRYALRFTRLDFMPAA